MTNTKFTASDPFTDLVVSMLSVNSYKLEKAYALSEKLNLLGLTNPTALAAWQPHDIYKRLVEAGYDRGEFITYLLAERLSSIGKRIVSEGVPHWTSILTSKNAVKIENILSGAKGIGPVVLQNYFVLQSVSVKAVKN